MPRTDDDTWGITESVGATALGVAAARAAETESAEPLIHDPFARMFVDAAGKGVWSIYGSVLGDDVDAEVREMAQAMVDFMAVRTAYFDEFFRAATDGGLRQVVILASGLDARAWRLGWPDDTVVFELDQPKVLDFKAAALRRHGAQPTARLVYVPVDLRRDWPKALCEAGFDPARPTVWLAEGLLRYLTAPAQDLLLERVHALSAPASWFATNAVSPEAVDPGHLARQRGQMQRLRSAATELAGTDVVDIEELWYPQERSDVATRLHDHGWDVSTETMRELLMQHRRSMAGNALFPSVFVTARLNWP